jgi:hypothetical protein
VCYAFQEQPLHATNSVRCSPPVISAPAMKIKG